MPRSRPASSPLSFHKPTGQFYVTRGGKRIYLGANQDEALEKYHRLALGLQAVERQASIAGMSAKELANRFLDAQQANWRSPVETLRSYRHWLERFLADHPGLQAEVFTAEMFAAWKMSLRRQGLDSRFRSVGLRVQVSLGVVQEDAGDPAHAVASLRPGLSSILKRMRCGRRRGLRITSTLRQDVPPENRSKDTRAKTFGAAPESEV